MSRWAPEGGIHASAEENGNPEEGSPGSPLNGPLSSGPASSHSTRRRPAWLGVIPFFLSALFFLSAFFAIFSPLPLLIVGLKRRRSLLLAAAASNSVLVFLAAGPASFAIYFVFCVVCALAMTEVLWRSQSLTKAGAAALIAMSLMGWGTVTAYSKVYRVHPVSEMKQSVSDFVDHLDKTVAENGGDPEKTLGDPAEIEQWKQSLVAELPSAVAVLGLILIWANLVLLVRFNPWVTLLPLDQWKAPEWLVWPTILTGATLIFDFGPAGEVGRNLFKFFMAIYALQGLSVLGFFFNRWRVGRFIRLVAYLLAALVMTPLLLSLGFFDLWFDFRSKFRQS